MSQHEKQEKKRSTQPDYSTPPTLVLPDGTELYNQTTAGRFLGMTRNALVDMIEKYNLPIFRMPGKGDMVFFKKESLLRLLTPEQISIEDLQRIRDVHEEE